MIIDARRMLLTDSQQLSPSQVTKTGKLPGIMIKLCAYCQCDRLLTSVCLSVTLCIVALRVGVGFERTTLPVHFFTQTLLL